MAGDWTDERNDAVVADYFAMLADDIAGRSYSKAEHNRLLQAAIRLVPSGAPVELPRKTGLEAEAYRAVQQIYVGWS